MRALYRRRPARLGRLAGSTIMLATAIRRDYIHPHVTSGAELCRLASRALGVARLGHSSARGGRSRRADRWTGLLAVRAAPISDGLSGAGAVSRSHRRRTTLLAAHSHPTPRYSRARTQNRPSRSSLSHAP